MSSQRLSSHFMVYAASGAMIMAPMNMWIWPSWLSAGCVSLNLAISRSSRRSREGADGRDHGATDAIDHMTTV